LLLINLDEQGEIISSQCQRIYIYIKLHIYFFVVKKHYDGPLFFGAKPRHAISQPKRCSRKLNRSKTFSTSKKKGAMILRWWYILMEDKPVHSTLPTMPASNHTVRPILTHGFSAPVQCSTIGHHLRHISFSDRHNHCSSCSSSSIPSWTSCPRPSAARRTTTSRRRRRTTSLTTGVAARRTISGSSPSN
jgi:hypothetical protein